MRIDCHHILCPAQAPAEGNTRLAEIAKPAAAREASGRLAGKQISTHPTLAVRTSFSCHPMIYYPRELFYTRMAGRGVTCYFCTRRWKSVCQRAYARTDSACHTSSLPALFIMNNEGVWGETPCSRTALPEWRGGITCYFPTRRRQPVCQKAHARTGSACRTGFLPALFIMTSEVVWCETP